MIFKNIKRRCGHEEQIGIAGYCGQVEDIDNLRDKQTVWDNIKDAESKLCLPCLKNLSHEERKKEVQCG